MWMHSPLPLPQSLQITVLCLLTTEQRPRCFSTEKQAIALSLCNTAYPSCCNNISSLPSAGEWSQTHAAFTQGIPFFVLRCKNILVLYHCDLLSYNIFLNKHGVFFLFSMPISPAVCTFLTLTKRNVAFIAEFYIPVHLHYFLPNLMATSLIILIHLSM